MLTFLSPLFLIGLASAAIPLIIHLTRSRRTKRMTFSTTRFFTDQFLRSYRMSQAKELLLLLLRMALFSLFAMALAKPLLRPTGGKVLFGQSRGVVLVIDNSASMGYTDGGATLLDRARDAARQVLDSLEPGSTAAVVLAARRAAGPDVIFPELTPELGDVRQAIDRVTPVSLGTDLSSAIDAAKLLLRSSQAESKEVYVFSDLQATGWESTDAEPPRHDDPLVCLVRVRPDQIQNVGITAVQYGSARPMVGVPFAIRAALRNDGESSRTVTARLFVDGEKDSVGERTIDVPANRWQIVRFHHTFTMGGWHWGRVSIDADNLQADNSRYFAFESQDSIRVLAVNGAPSSVPLGDELFFFRTALTVGGEDESPIRVDVIVPANMESAMLADYPLVVLANVESLPESAVEKLEQYADRGGNVIVSVGDKINADFYNRYFAGSTRLNGGLLPARIGELLGTPTRAVSGSQPGEGRVADSSEFGFVAAVDYDHPALAAFEDPKFGNLSSVSFRNLYRLEPREAATVLMRASVTGLSGGAPLLVEQRFGQGRVMLFASTIDRNWTNFPIRPSYLPWVYRLTSYLAQERLAKLPIVTTGSRVTIPFSAGEGLPQVLVKKPNGTTGHAVIGNDPAAPLEFVDTIEPGVYTVTEQGRQSSPKLFVANLDGDESRFEPFVDSVAELGESFPNQPLMTFVADPTRVNEASFETRRGVSLWDIILGVVLLIALLEPWFANRISKKHYSVAGELATREVQPRRLPGVIANPHLHSS